MYGSGAKGRRKEAKQMEEEEWLQHNEQGCEEARAAFITSSYSVHLNQHTLQNLRWCEPQNLCVWSEQISNIKIKLILM